MIKDTIYLKGPRKNLLRLKRDPDKGDFELMENVQVPGGIVDSLLSTSSAFYRSGNTDAQVMNSASKDSSLANSLEFPEML